MGCFCDKRGPQERSKEECLSSCGLAYKRPGLRGGQSGRLRGKTDRLRARDLASWKGKSRVARGGRGKNEGRRPRPGLPPEPTGPLLDDGRGHTASLETRSPSRWADGGVLGPGGRPSFSVFNEPYNPLLLLPGCRAAGTWSGFPVDREEDPSPALPASRRGSPRPFRRRRRGASQRAARW